MRLVPIPDRSGTPTIWINPDQLVSVAPAFQTTEGGVRLDVELKVAGMQSFKVHLEEYPDRAAAADGFQRFIDRIQARLENDTGTNPES